MKNSKDIPLKPLPFKKKRMSLKVFLENMYCRYEDDEVPAMGAQLTYYLILSFFPFLIFILSLLSFTDMNAQDAITTITRVLPKLSNQMILNSFEEIQNSKSGSLLSIGILATLWSASSGINAVLKALNKAYDAEENRPYWKVQGLSIIFTIALAIVIILSLFMLIFGKLIGETIYKFVYLPGSFETIWRFAQYIIPLPVMVIAFIFLYLFLPNLRLKVKDVLPGALFATVGWVVTSLLFSFYVNNFSNYSKTYGSIGGIIVLLTWLYLSSMVIVLGGEVNATLHFDREGKNKIDCKKFSFTIPFFNRKKDHTHTL
ncbi:YihY/virulence factor BrkB family protein [Paenibacillus sp. GP183]|uniref:YihY/virulence factor BrkB family protein n=1 Tax=Paenibacillus sp. GP183 TaxID=1882751 RepID=UPI00089493D6|nr:YihY/virulence factor BrkB family protein [Paenibacillus sp. GP183]SEB54454.1 membrane protein [Paenibacillus sp. GP183]